MTTNIEGSDIYNILPETMKLIEQRQKEIANFGWMDLVKEFTRISDQFLFDGESHLHHKDYYDTACRFDERKDQIHFVKGIIMDAESFDDLAIRIKNANSDLLLDGTNIYGQLANKIKYLDIYFGIEKVEREELKSADLAILHILYKVFNDENLPSVILDRAKSSTFLRFYHNQYNPYSEVILFIRSCFLQQIGFKEAWNIEYVRGLIYSALNATEDMFYDNIKKIVSNMDKEKERLLLDNSVESAVRKKLCDYISSFLEGEVSKEYKWNDPVSDNLTKDEVDFVCAYFHFITLGIEDVINKPLIILNNTKAFIKRLDRGFNFLPNFKEWFDYKSLGQFVKSNSLYIAQFIADEELDLVIDQKELEKRKNNIENHCDNYIKLCKFMYDANFLRNINSTKFLIFIYLYEKCSRDGIMFKKEGYRGGKVSRNSISMKAVFRYVSERVDLDFLKLGEDLSKYIKDQINGKNQISYSDFLKQQEEKDIGRHKRITAANQLIDDDEVTKIKGVIAFANTVESLYHRESKALIKSRKRMRSYLFEYLKRNIPLLKQKNFPVKRLTDLKEKIFPQMLLWNIMEFELRHCKIKK
ncbi:MAG: hypothetical protein ABFC84_16020 [Veillonellales bacterium]